jgi:hypothetical protein
LWLSAWPWSRPRSHYVDFVDRLGALDPVVHGHPQANKMGLALQVWETALNAWVRSYCGCVFVVRRILVHAQETGCLESGRARSEQAHDLSRRYPIDCRDLRSHSRPPSHTNKSTYKPKPLPPKSARSRTEPAVSGNEAPAHACQPNFLIHAEASDITIVNNIIVTRGCEPAHYCTATKVTHTGDTTSTFSPVGVRRPFRGFTRNTTTVLEFWLAANR